MKQNFEFRMSKSAVVAGIVSLALMLSAWMCNGSQIHKANQASKSVADGLHEFESSVEQQFSVGMLDKDEAKSLAQLASDASLVDDEFIGHLKTIKTIDGSNVGQVTAWFDELRASVDRLNNDGVLHLKSADAKAKFAFTMQGIQAGLTTLEGLITGLKSEIPADTPIQKSELDASAILLLLAAFNSLAKLLVQARADGSLTDEQLQAAGLAENEDTRNHAAAFIASLEDKSDSPTTS